MTKSVDVTLPSDREITITRRLNAPARVVFEAHTRPEYIKAWLLGPEGWDMPVCTIDLRVGGKYEYVWRSRDGENQFGSHGVYKEISVPDRIVNTERMDGAEGEALCTLTLEEHNGQTLLTSTMQFADKATRDMALASGMTEGVGTSYDRLESKLGQWG